MLEKFTIASLAPHPSPHTGLHPSPLTLTSTRPSCGTRPPSILTAKLSAPWTDSKTTFGLGVVGGGVGVVGAGLALHWTPAASVCSQSCVPQPSNLWNTKISEFAVLLKNLLSYLWNMFLNLHVTFRLNTTILTCTLGLCLLPRNSRCYPSRFFLSCIHTGTNQVRLLLCNARNFFFVEFIFWEDLIVWTPTVYPNEVLRHMDKSVTID